MRSIVNADLIFGPAHIAVGVAGAETKSDEPTAKNLHSVCRTPLSVRRAGSSVGGTTVTECVTCNAEVSEDQIVKGFEFAKGEYAVFTKDELAMINPERSATIELKKFVPLDQIKNVMIEKHYFLIPNKTITDPYGLLYQGLAETRRAGLGSQTLWGKEHPCAVFASSDYEGGVLMMATLRLAEDLVSPDFSAPIPDQTYMDLTRLAIQTLSTDLDPSADLVSRSRQELQAAIKERIEGRELVVHDGDIAGRMVSDFQDALKQMVESAGTPDPKKKPRPKTPPKKATPAKKPATTRRGR